MEKVHRKYSSTMGKTALLVVDMQNDFCLPDGKLCVGGAMKCLPNVIEAVNIARSHQIPVIWVVREHDVSGKSLGFILVKGKNILFPLKVTNHPGGTLHSFWLLKPILEQILR